MIIHLFILSSAVQMYEFSYIHFHNEISFAILCLLSFILFYFAQKWGGGGGAKAPPAPPPARALKLNSKQTLQTLNQVTSGIVQVALQSLFSCSRKHHFGVFALFEVVSS